VGNTYASVHITVKTVYAQSEIIISSVSQDYAFNSGSKEGLSVKTMVITIFSTEISIQEYTHCTILLVIIRM
jgi:hypothetical protein